MTKPTIFFLLLIFYCHSTVASDAIDAIALIKKGYKKDGSSVLKYNLSVKIIDVASGSVLENIHGTCTQSMPYQCVIFDKYEQWVNKEHAIKVDKVSKEIFVFLIAKYKQSPAYQMNVEDIVQKLISQKVNVTKVASNSKEIVGYKFEFGQGTTNHVFVEIQKQSGLISRVETYNYKSNAEGKIVKQKLEMKFSNYQILKFNSKLFNSDNVFIIKNKRAIPVEKYKNYNLKIG